MVVVAAIKLLMPTPLTEAEARDIEIGRTIDNLSYSQQVRIQQIVNELQPNKS